MTRFTVPRRLGRVCVLALAALALGLMFGGSALARVKDGIRVAKPIGAKRNSVYDVIVSGFSNRQAKAYLFVDYKRCAATLAAETTQTQALPNEKKVYTVHGAFTRVSGWKSPVSKLDHACVYLVNPKTGRLLASGGTGYLVR
jgi:hypothetical protein